MTRHRKGQGPGVNAAMLAKWTPFADFSEGSGRVQCRATTRLGERCRKDAVQGVSCCRSHGGTSGAITLAKRDPRFRRAANNSVARHTLADIAFAAIAEGEIGRPGEGLAAIARRVLLCQKVI
jgi:hypothetical protein